MLLTFSFMKYIGAAENEYFNKLSLREGFPFCDRGELEFLSFCVTRHSWRPRELSSRKVTYMGGFCSAKGCYIRRSITLVFMSPSRDEFTLS